LWDVIDCHDFVHEKKPYVLYEEYLPQMERTEYLCTALGWAPVAAESGNILRQASLIAKPSEGLYGTGYVGGSWSRTSKLPSNQIAAEYAHDLQQDDFIAIIEAYI